MAINFNSYLGGTFSMFRFTNGLFIFIPGDLFKAINSRLLLSTPYKEMGKLFVLNQY